MPNNPSNRPRLFPGRHIRELLQWPDGKADERIAVTFEGNDLSYGALDRQSLELAAGLTRMNIARSDCVATFIPNSLEIYQLYFATANFGGIFLPINVALSAVEVGYLLQHAKPKILFSRDDLSGLVQRAVQLADCQTKVIYLDARVPSGSRLTSLMVAGARPQSAADPEDIVIVSYTSGTTANPKAMAYSHRVEVTGCGLYTDAWALCPSDTVLVSMSMGWTYGINPGSFPALRGGARIVLLEKFNPVRVLEAIEASKVTVMLGVPTMYGMMVEHVTQTGKKYDLSSIRIVLCAGAELPTALELKFKEVFGIGITNFLGMGEVKLVASPRVGSRENVPVGSVGKPPPGVEIRLVDETGEDVASGEVGEILVKSPAWMTGYFLEPEKTVAVLKDGWYVSGDLGHFNRDGFLFVSGRTRDQIIRGGAKVAPAEVEDALAAHPDVVLSAVIGIPDALYGEKIKAFVISRNPSLSASDLKEFCAAQLASFKVPTDIDFVSELPIGPTGKVLKKALRPQP